MIKRMLIEMYMLVAFILLFFKGSTGQHEHEALGLAFTVLMIGHLILYRARIKILIKQSVQLRNISQLVNLVFLVLFTLCMMLTIISGIISSELWMDYVSGTDVLSQANSISAMSNTGSVSNLSIISSLSSMSSEMRNMHLYFSYGTIVFMVLHIIGKGKVLIKKLIYIFTH